MKKRRMDIEEQLAVSAIGAEVWRFRQGLLELMMN
jgi:hypothetical protein